MTVRSTLYKVSSCGRSDVGLVRQNNEDAWEILCEQQFYILADGMGGHRAGEVASRETVDGLSKHVRNALKSTKGDIDLHVAIINDIIQKVNHDVYQKARSDSELRGMGTTLCCTYFHEKGVVFAHVGDSRIYRFHDKKLYQLTRDHSLVAEMIDLGELSEKNVSGVNYKNIITRAIGTEPSVEVSIGISEFYENDLFMMCSDGLSDLLSPTMIENILKKAVDLRDTVDQLIDAAIERGGKDNVTAVLMRVENGNEKPNLSR
jgi:serine/threonine protein phosphatase PrpC